MFILVLNKELCKTVMASNDDRVRRECMWHEIPALFWDLNAYS